MSSLSNEQAEQRPAARLGPAPVRAAVPRALGRPWLLGLAVFCVAFLARAIAISSSFDIFIDEITYLRIGQRVEESLRVELYGETFYLHPPAFFFFEAAYLALTRPDGDAISQIYAARYLNCLFAGLSATALFQIGRRAAGWLAGLAAAAIFALDPFIIKMNSLVLLDTSAVWWALAGYWAIAGGMGPEQPRPPAAPLRLVGELLREAGWRGAPMAADIVPLPRWRILVAGLCFGLALLTKDMTAFLSLLPLGICFVLRWALTRRDSFSIGVLVAAVYAIYPATVAIVGDWERFAAQKLRGALRLAGAVQETGLNREGGPSLVEVIIARLDQFGTTYALIGGGVAALLVLLVVGGQRGRLLLAFTASAYALLAYCIIFGTLEEQFFYMLVVPCLLAIAAAVALLRPLLAGRARRGLELGVAALALIFALWTGYHWAVLKLTPDNSYERTLSYIQQRLAPEADVAATSETGQFLLEEYGSGPWGRWHTVEQLKAADPDYLLVDPYSLNWNYGADAAPLLAWLEQEAELVFAFQGRGDTLLELYRLP